MVNKVYNEYSDVFLGMKLADFIDFTQDHTSIKLSQDCNQGETVDFNGTISEGEDRVEYYKELHKRLKILKGW